MRRAAPALALVIAVVAALPSSVSAAPFGALDTTFSGDGLVTLPGGAARLAEPLTVVTRPGGGTASGGYARVGPEEHFALALHDAGGNETATTTTEVGDGNARIGRLIVLDGGGLLAVGSARSGQRFDLALARYDADGQLDTSFGTGGTALIPVGSEGFHEFDVLRGRALGVHDAWRAADGDVLVTGSTREGAMEMTYVARIRPDGTLEPDFADSGLLLTDVAGGCSEGVAVREVAGGKIAVMGWADQCEAGHGFVMRLGPDGSFDDTFGTCGIVEVDMQFGFATAGTVDAAGRYVLAGYSINRLLEDGSPDPSFGGDGRIELPLAEIGEPSDVDVLPDGRVWIVGDDTGIMQTTALLEADGDPDPTYDGDGFGPSSPYRPIAATIDGSSLVTVGTERSLPLTIYDSLGSDFVRRTVQTDGTVSAPVRTGLGGAPATMARRILPLGDGTTLIAGERAEGQTSRLAVWRLTSTGALDPAWSGDGLAEPASGGRGARGAAIARTASGLVYVGGAADAADGAATLTVHRLNADGTPDSAWSGDGMAQAPVRPPGVNADPTCQPPEGLYVFCRDDDGHPAWGGVVTAILPQPSGEVFVAGLVGSAGLSSGDGHIFGLARFEADGSLDTAFGTGGVAQYYVRPNGIIAFNSLSGPEARDVGGGKVRVVGVHSLRQQGEGAIVAQFQVDAATGALDPAFDGDGRRAFAIGDVETEDLQLQPDGSAVITATALPDPEPRTLARLGADGSFDTAFGTSGLAQLTTPGFTGHPEIPDGSFRFKPLDSLDFAAVLPDGRVVAPLVHSALAPRAAATVASNADGDLATDYGTGGVLATPVLCGRHTTGGLATDAGGNLLLASHAAALSGSEPDSPQRFPGPATLVRYTDGAPGTSVACAPDQLLTVAQGSGMGAYTCEGTANGSPAPSLAYQWLRDDDEIAGATSDTYTPAAADAGHVIGCRIVASNPSGSITRSSFPRRLPGTRPPGRTCGGEDPGPEPEPEPDPAPAPPATTEPPPLAPTPPATLPTPVAQPRPAPGAAPSVSRLLSLPSSRRCASRRRFRVRVRSTIRGQVRRVTIFVNGRRAARVTGRRLGLPIDLRGLPKGRVRVRLVVELADGRTATDRRAYRTCATKKRRGRFGRRRRS